MDQNDFDGPDNENGQASEDSSAEMDIIKQAFGSEEPEASPPADVFSVDLFGGSADEKKPEASAEPEAAPEEKQESVSPLSGKQKAGIKIVTDDDLKDLFDMSSPGSALPDQQEPAADEQVEELSSPEEEEAEEPEEEGAEGEKLAEEPAAESAESAQAEEVEELSLDEPETTAAETEEAESEEISPEEIVSQLEERAQVGEMTSVAAGKKGQLLEQTEELINQIEPVTEDFLSVAELRKLFNNMNVLVRMVRQLAERVDSLEDEFVNIKPKK